MAFKLLAESAIFISLVYSLLPKILLFRTYFLHFFQTELFPLISTVLCSQDDKQAEKALVPLGLLKEAFPEYLSVLEEVAHTYVRQCAKDVSSVTQCSGEEGQRLTAFLTLYKGNGG